MYLFLLVANAALSSHTVKVSATGVAENTVKTLMKLVCYVSLSISVASVVLEQVTISGGVLSVDSIQKISFLA